MVLAYRIRFDLLLGYEGAVGVEYYLRLLVVILPFYLLLFQHFGLYQTFRYKSLIAETTQIIKVNLCGVLFVFLLSFLLKEVNVSRLVIVLFACVDVAFSCVVRICLRLSLRYIRRRGYNIKRMLLVGWNDSSGEFYKKISANKNYGYEITGFLSDKLNRQTTEGAPYLGTISKLEAILESNEIDDVVISLDADEFALLGEVISVCEGAGVKSSLLPFYTKYLPTKPYIDEVDGMPLINLIHIPLDNIFFSFIKRSFDIAASLLGLTLLSPFLLFIAATIKFTSPGPIIYKQSRIGRNKKEFTMYKFRSMRWDNPADTTTWGTKKDNRRTKFGAFIRKCSIDELPQLFNVLKGDMSLIGPRPERAYFVEQFRGEVPLYMLKHLVRPGMTGWAQVNGWRGDTSIVERIKCDIYYIENWSLLFDIKIILLTISKGILNPSEEL